MLFCPLWNGRGLCCLQIFNRPKGTSLPPPSVERAIEPTVSTYAVALHRTPALFLQIATEFATVRNVFSPSQPIRPDAVVKLAALRRLDKGRDGTPSTRLGQSEPVKYWEIIADRLHAEGRSYGIAEHFTKHGFLFCVDAQRDGKRFIVKVDDLLTAFLSLERDAIAR